MSNLRTGTYGKYYGSLIDESAPLTQSQMETNATYIYSFLTAKGWSINAIAAVLGNMNAESTLNPGRWQSDSVGWTSGGYGLVQWTPTTRHISWCEERGLDPSAMDSNLTHLNWEILDGDDYYPTTAFPLSFQEFTQSMESPGYLAKAFLLNYERPYDQSESAQSFRAGLAESWYTYISGQEPTPPTPDTPTTKKKRKYNFVLFGNKPWRKRQWQS